MSVLECPVCSSENLIGCKILQCLFGVWKCRDCSFRWVDRDDLWNNDHSSVAQTRAYARSTAKSFEGLKPLYVKNLRNRVNRCLDGHDPANHSFLDIGCVNGQYMWAAKELGFCTVAGVETDKDAATRASDFGEVVANPSKLSQQGYDIVFIHNAISNIIDFRAFLTESVALMNTGGSLILDMPNNDGLVALASIAAATIFEYDGQYGVLQPPHVINGFNSRSIKLLYSQLSLEPSWISTSSQANSLVSGTFGFAGTLIGKGSILLTEARKTA